MQYYLLINTIYLLISVSVQRETGINFDNSIRVLQALVNKWKSEIIHIDGFDVYTFIVYTFIQFIY